MMLQRTFVEETETFSLMECQIPICSYVKALLHRDLGKWKRHLIDRRIKTDLYFRQVGEQITTEWRLIYGTE